MIIDAHTHIGASGFAGMESADVEAYVEQLRGRGVDRGFAFTLDGLLFDAKRGNDDLARARDRYPDVVLPWGTVYPYWPEGEIRAEIRRCIQGMGFYGLKFHPWLQGTSLMLSGFDAVAEECIALDVPVTFHDGTPVYCTALQVAYYARKYPQLKVLSGHGGLRELWRDYALAAPEIPNLWICLSGPTMQGMQTLYEGLGADRLLYGSDGGFGHPGAISSYLRRVRALHAPPEDIEKILGLNAMRLVGLI